MSRISSADFLVEIGTEELPPKALAPLMNAFAGGFADQLDEVRLAHGEVVAYATPRRLAIKVRALADTQADRKVERRGPPLARAFDAQGQPTRAALAFAEKHGVAVEALTRETTAKGEWLVHRWLDKGRPAAGLLPQCVSRALENLPIPRRMRWGASEVEFVRPVHWVLMLYGKDVVPGTVLGIEAGRVTQGHRFMGTQSLTVSRPDDYPAKLANEGYVLADLNERRRRIVEQVSQAASEAGGVALGGEALFDEVAALTEWPVALTGRFADEFLALPKEVIVATLTGHQRYFPVAREDGELLPVFVTVANIASRAPETVRDGNERVIRPRLADAAFFWEADRRTSLADRQAALGNVVYQQGLGTLEDKSGRVAALAAAIAGEIGADPDTAQRAALLSKCDLLSGMVGEFPELQGTMGRHYALADGEPAPVAEALGEQYLPRFANDRLPQTSTGRALALADKLDTLCGVFALGKKPSGNRDPFGLRRAALGIVRILIEGGLDVNLAALIDKALQLQPGERRAAADRGEVYAFIIDRLRGWYPEQGPVTAEMFEAVRAREPASLLDFDARLQAVARFVENDAAESLASANKRIVNILRQAGYAENGETFVAHATGKLHEDAERELCSALAAAREAVAGPLASRDYAAVLGRLAELRQPVDRFFDDVMVMTEDDELRRERLKLLAGLRAEFLNVADISKLPIARA